MAVTLILGPARSGKTTALRERFFRWLAEGVRTDQILILTHGAEQTAPWTRGLPLPASGAIEAHDFYGFIRQELTLHWPAVQAKVEPARRWLAPAFLPLTVERHLLQALLEPHYALFGDGVKAASERLALQLLTRVDRAAAAAGLTPGEAVRRMAEADRPEKRLLYGQVAALLEEHRARLLAAGLLDYGLALTLFLDHLMPDPAYRAHLRARFRRLLVDDLDEAAPAEQAFVAAMAEAVEEAALALDPEGGHTLLFGSDPAAILARFAGAEWICLPDPAPDLEARLAAIRLAGTGPDQPEQAVQQPAQPCGQPGQPQRSMQTFGQRRQAWTLHLTAEFWGDMVRQTAEAVAGLVAQGVPPGEIAVIAPRVDSLLANALGQRLTARGIALQPLVPVRRLLDEPAVRAIVVLAGLAVPAWRPPWPSSGAFADAVRLLLGQDPLAAAQLGEVLWRAEGDLPDPAGHPAPYRILHAWLRAARRRAWQPDEFVRAALLELVLPLRPDLPPEAVEACRQLLRTAADFRLAAERLEAVPGLLAGGPFGPGYRPLLTEATAPFWPPKPPESQAAVLLATPRAYLSRRLTSAVQVWLDVTAPGWLSTGVAELANPHVLAPDWPEGRPWTDEDARRVREAARGRIARALLRRCTGRVITAEAALSPWLQEQEGGLMP